MAHVVAGSLGVSTLVLASAELFTTLKLVGAAYLVWIGFHTFQAARRDALATLSDGQTAPPLGSRRAQRADAVFVSVPDLDFIQDGIYTFS